ncbi:MAG: hypothetical protein EXR75_00745 [Myxococcales bacterium]|nr:hypothetical protein [Myxococcales bacterium]
MANAVPRSAESSAASVLGAFLHGLLEGKRAALLGDGSTGLAQELASASGRRVQVFDPDARRTAEAITRGRGSNSQVRHSLLEADAETPGQPFDVVLVPNVLATTDKNLDPAAVIAIARQLASARGVVVVSAPNPEHPGAPGDEKLGYYQLFDLMAAHFEHVTMLGQAPFAGYSIARFGAESEPAVTIDTSLMNEAEEPLAFIAVGSAHPVELDPFTLVEVPVEEQSATPSDAPTESVPPTRLSDPLVGELRERIVLLEQRELELLTAADERRNALLALSTRAVETELSLAKVHGELGPLQERVERADRDLAAERAAGAEEQLLLTKTAALSERPHYAVEADAQVATERAPTLFAAPAAHDDGKSRERAYEFQLSELRRALDAARAEHDELRLDGPRAKVLEAEVERLTRQLRTRPAVSPDDTVGNATAHSDTDVANYERLLRDRGARVTQLERDLGESERLGRELVQDLMSARAEREAQMLPANATGADDVTKGVEAEEAAMITRDEPLRLHEKLDALLRRCTRAEADLEQARLVSQAFERRCSERPSDGADHDKLEAALLIAHEENARLRQMPR